MCHKRGNSREGDVQWLNTDCSESQSLRRLARTQKKGATGACSSPTDRRHSALTARQLINHVRRW